jgi:alkylhydroperoxidase family enzyme
MSNPIDDEHIEDSQEFVEASGSIWEKYQEWQKELATESVFDNKTRELLMLAASAAAQCPYCVLQHSVLTVCILTVRKQLNMARLKKKLLIQYI